MTDVAQACGVSQATVSLVLNDAPGTRISMRTREAVREAARSLGYAPPRRAKASALVAMLIDDVTCSPHVAGLIEGVSAAAAETGLLLSVIPTSGDDDTALDHLESVGARGVIYARLVTQAVAPPARLARFPTVLLNCHAEGDPYPSVVPGDLAAATTATLALLDAGHRRVGLLGGEDRLEAGRDRLAGYRRALAMRDLPLDPDLVVKDAWTPRGGAQGLRRLLALPDPATAVFCYCDRTAIGVYAAAAALGLSIPRDLSVIGFDDEPYTPELEPPLTTMELPHADMARHALEILAGILDKEGAHRRHPRMKFECPLIARASVAPPRAAQAGRRARRAGE